MQEVVQSFPWLIKAAFSDFSGGVMNFFFAIISALVVAKLLHFWPLLWNKSWNGASVLFLALIGGGAVGMTVILICGTYKFESYIQSWFKRTEKILVSDPGWRRIGFTEAARKLWEPTQPTIDEGIIRVDLKNSADWELLVNSQHQAAKDALASPEFKVSFLTEESDILIPLPHLNPPATYPVTIGPDNLWTGHILKSVISAYQKEATEAGIQLAKKARLAASGATLCLIPMIMIALAVAADRDIPVH
jgi:hypothetical protein